ncbi:CRISPR-associated helicase/endonuclease Cas3 [Anaerocolumna xylanovorans]|uniref:CRISPR-associated endonuclease/helicase Cas3 n=1 Tax=Anaerocolumna xylanovorans DSM 12503 TaxID=1121345 RepID=A0A1M7YEI0_9FIRM|nr:CRISPR-associated helicase/endonuclease Cas3 [Anaerocolumna xylanovorans]SHO50989.1 CRISPR-associated endonuclease/helicase Cas3 [Anaerocolumna xylanovorans DSM 12503]
MLINRETVPISNMLNPEYNFYAHKKTEENLKRSKDETIAEHTERCVYHFKNIVKEKGLEAVFSNFEKKWLDGCGSEELELFWDMLLNTITFHDIGKLNPLFQKDKMKNSQFSRERGRIEFGSQHSLISAVFYLEYYLPKSKSYAKEIRNQFRLLTYVNAYIISRHHSSLEQLDNFISDFFLKEDYKDKWEIIVSEFGKFLTKEADFMKEGYGKRVRTELEKCCPKDGEGSILLYAYEKLLYSLLIASDYYATTEYSDEYILDSHGTLEDMSYIIESYGKSMVMQNIRAYQQGEKKEGKIRTEDEKAGESWWEERNMNILRSELFLEAERELIRNKEERIFYLEAPTGSGKSNTALNLSFRLMELCTEMKKLWYIYPFNTLVEQNMHSLEKIFGQDQDILKQIRVVNSITPIGTIYSNKMYTKESGTKENEQELNEYVKALLDRQFFHYPITLSTHVTLFDILFGGRRESGFGFYQIANSVIILDEVQSYRNEIWTEIIHFLKVFAEALNMKIIIMSATLPDLDRLSLEQTKAVRLIKDRERYFKHPVFKNRVELRYDLLKIQEVEEQLTKYIKEYLNDGKKVLVEFLYKTSADNFFRQICCDADVTCKVRLMTGDDNSMERNNILKELEEEPDETGFLLIATQVIEAGVDIQNMDVGFKNISMLDSEEQFMGRINRSCLKEGIVYIFRLDEPRTIYGRDVRLEKALTLDSPKMRDVLTQKSFAVFYEEVFNKIQQINRSLDVKKNLQEFWEQTGRLNQQEVSERMYLINEDERQVPVFLAREIRVSEDEVLKGKEVWMAYEELLQEKNLKYAEMKVRQSIIQSQMSYFIYHIKKGIPIAYNRQVGEIYYIEDGEQYFDNGKLDRKKLENQSEIL